MDIERKRVNPQPAAEVPASGRHDLAADAYEDAYDDISQSDDVSEAIHAPQYRVREERGDVCRGSDRLNVNSKCTLSWSQIISQQTDFCKLITANCKTIREHDTLLF